MNNGYDISFLKLYLEKMEITQSYLTEELGVSRKVIHRWLNGICLMPESYLPKLLKVLKVNSYDELRELVTDIYKYLPNIKKMGKDLVFRSLILQDSSNDEYIIVQMLFGVFGGRYYCIEEIASILSIPKKYILDVYYKYMNNISTMDKICYDNKVYSLSMNNL